MSMEARIKRIKRLLEFVEKFGEGFAEFGFELGRSSFDELGGRVF